MAVRNRTVLSWGMSLALVVMTLAGCSKPSANQGSSATSVKVILGWYAKGEDGGYFAALKNNEYAERGIDMTIQPGGPEISSLQLVASGEAEFGIGYADDILRAREEGIPVVGLFAAFQFTPQVLIYHADQAIDGFEQLEGRTIYLSPGVLYWAYIKKKYQLKNVTEMNYSGQLINFIKEKESLNQGYVTNEPYALAQQGIDVAYLKVADSGYANYANVLFTTETYLNKHPEVVKSVVQATKEGWTYYLDHYEEINPFIQTYNQEVPLEALHYEAEAERDFILTGDALEKGIGIMTTERWELLQEQLIEIGGLKKKQDVSSAFTTAFLE